MAAYAKTAQYALYVAGRFQGRGIGEKLVRKLQEESGALGLDNLMGVIFSDNFPSLKLCHKLGFSEWGYLPGVTEFSGKTRDVIFLGWRRI
jgi:phosphinothricin acetyltransferase